MNEGGKLALAERAQQEMSRFYRDPQVVLAEATNCARELKRVIEAKPSKVVLNGETYPEYEDWSLVAAFYQHTAKIREDRFITLPNGVTGWEAVADCLDPHGNVVATANSMCLNDEDNWSTRPEYEWRYDEEAKKRVKVEVGRKQVPTFQLRSMAQTRACARVLKLRFSWVMVLAGYKPIVSEELTSSDKANMGGEGGGETVKKVTDGMLRILYAKLDKLGVDKKERNKYLTILLGKEVPEHLHDLAFEDGRAAVNECEKRIADRVAEEKRKAEAGGTGGEGGTK